MQAGVRTGLFRELALGGLFDTQTIRVVTVSQVYGLSVEAAFGTIIALGPDHFAPRRGIRGFIQRAWRRILPRRLEQRWMGLPGLQIEIERRRLEADAGEGVGAEWPSSMG